MLVLQLVGTHLCANQPPYSNIIIKCQMNIINNTETNSLAKLSKI